MYCQCSHPPRCSLHAVDARGSGGVAAERVRERAALRGLDHGRRAPLREPSLHRRLCLCLRLRRRSLLGAALVRGCALRVARAALPPVRVRVRQARRSRTPPATACSLCRSLCRCRSSAELRARHAPMAALAKSVSESVSLFPTLRTVLVVVVLRSMQSTLTTHLCEFLVRFFFLGYWKSSFCAV